MEQSQEAWGFVIALAAVINGLGIVRLIGALGDYAKKGASLTVHHYWPYGLTAVFQLLMHVMLWWSVLGLVEIAEINFLNYLYLLLGPTLLFLSTTLLLPEVADSDIDLKAEYHQFRKSYYSIMFGFWLWVIFLWPAFGYPFAPTVPALLVWLALSLTLRLSKSDRLHVALTVANLVLFGSVVAKFALELGGVGRMMAQ